MSKEPGSGTMHAIDSADLTSLALYYRDMCQCPMCVDTSSQQKLFQTSDIPLDIEIATMEPVAKGMAVRFNNDMPGFDNHVGFVPDKFFEKIEVDEPRRKTLWNRDQMKKDVLWIDYADYSRSDGALLKALQQLAKYGLVFLRNVPDNEKSVISIASRIGPLRDTFYGRTWDVKSVPDAKNIAYTQQFLGLHMDLLYMTNPPHLQFLHSLRARAPGGESLFSDSYYAAEMIRQNEPAAFEALCFEPVTFHYHNSGHHYRTTRTTVELDVFGIEGGHGGIRFNDASLFLEMPPERCRAPTPHSLIRRINWSPPFQAPVTPQRFCKGAQAGVQPYVAATKMFSNLVNAEENVYELKLGEGDCVIFDNRRVLHARKAFDARAGERWLKGAYVDDDAFFSKLRVLEKGQRRGRAH